MICFPCLFKEMEFSPETDFTLVLTPVRVEIIWWKMLRTSEVFWSAEFHSCNITSVHPFLSPRTAPEVGVRHWNTVTPLWGAP